MPPLPTAAHTPKNCPNHPGLDVAELFRRLAAGATLEDVLREQPRLKPQELRAYCAYVAELFGNAAVQPAKNETIEWTAANASEPSPAVNEAATLAPTADTATATPSKRISLPGYEILGKLGEGGMGVVYKARHLRLNRIVAIKMILAGEHATEAMIARFAVEAEAVAQLQHPGIVQIHEIGEHDGHSFLALEYVAGGSLAARLDDKPWSADRAAELVESLARSMHVAHDHGIVHRDLKPENVLLAESADAADGQRTPKITDFGLAKRLQETAGRTRTGEVMGTPSYMAPEQAAGKKDIGPAADVYALGAILYRLLAGHPPFQADTSLDTMMLVLEQEPVPLRTLNKKLPRDLETITLKCLAKEPAKRYASAADLADDLRRFQDGEPIKARRLSVRQRLFRWCRKRPGAAFARSVLIVLLLAFVGLLSIADQKAGLIFLALSASAVFVFIASTRARLRPFLIGLSISLVLALAWGICWALQVSWVQASSADSWYTFKVIFPGFTAENLAILACLLPLLIGLLGGLFSIVRWRLLGYCLVALFLLAGLQWPEVSKSSLSVFILPLYLGLVCRFVRWHCESNLMDTVVGALWGTVVGFLIGATLFGLVLLAVVKPGSNPANPEMSVGLVTAGVLYATTCLGGSILGAYLGAMIGNRSTRRGRG